MWKEDTVDRRIRLDGYGPNSCTIGRLTREEVETMQAFALGTCWVRVGDDGRLESRPRFEPLPPPEQDPAIPPKWITVEDWTGQASWLANAVSALPDEPKPSYGHPAIIIQHLCGYNRTPYEFEARKLQSYGFQCLRSRRGPDGRFWEIWYLCSLVCAKGGLKQAVAGITEREAEIRTAIDYLCKHVSFGTLDVCYQRAAMVID
jgi:hypothetical protein